MFGKVVAQNGGRDVDILNWLVGESPVLVVMGYPTATTAAVSTADPGSLKPSGAGQFVP